MSSKNFLLKNATIINEGSVFRGSLLINNSRIEQILVGEYVKEKEHLNYEELDCRKFLLFPGIIDDQVHFREPGATHKGDIESESRAAILGGVTSFMDMPNNNPLTTSIELLEHKYDLAKEKSYANYSFYLGASNENINQLEHIDKKNVCGIKVFMGSSTGNMLVDNINSLEKIFKIDTLIATHCEDEEIIRENLAKYKSFYGNNIPFKEHPNIRSREACIKSTTLAIDLALKYNTRLHILHISTKEEIELIKQAQSLNPKITAETCVHYLDLNSDKYDTLGSKMKCNPSIKDEQDRKAIINAVKEGVISVIATDHAPHTNEEKSKDYLNSPSGLPLIQHSFQIMYDLYKNGEIEIATISERMSHSPANVYRIKERGFIREGYFADLFLVDINLPDSVSTISPAYKCGWSPYKGREFECSIIHTFVNGIQVVKDRKITENNSSMRLEFEEYE